MSERDDNAVVFSPSGRAGHVESYFLKLNSPDGQRAFWFKWTVFADRAQPPRVETWALAFERGRAPRAVKRSRPLGPGALSFPLDVDGARFDGARASGELAGPSLRLSWDVTLTPRVPALRHLPYGWMYRARVPESKLLSPVADADVSGRVAVDGAAVDVAGWRGMQGHNWGTRHAHRYAWCHASGFDGADDVVFEALSGRLARGGVELPWLSLAFLWIDGAWLRFDQPRVMAATRVSASVLRYAFETPAVDGRVLRGEAEARPQEAAGLYYPNPDGSVTHCLNSKLAALSLELRGPSGARRFETRRAALELGWPSADHGVAMVA